MLQAVGNGASSSGTTDGTTTAINAAATNFLTASVIKTMDDGGNDFLQGMMVEIGVWPAAFSAANLTAMNSNVAVYWGF